MDGDAVKLLEEIFDISHQLETNTSACDSLYEVKINNTATVKK